MKKILTRHFIFPHRQTLISSISFKILRNLGSKRCFSNHSEDTELQDLMEYMDSLKNYEKVGVPKGAGMDFDDGFDLSRMRWLMVRLGNPQIGANHGQTQISLTSDRSNHGQAQISLTSDRSKPWPSSHIDLPLPLGSISLTTIFLSLTWGCWLL